MYQHVLEIWYDCWQKVLTKSVKVLTKSVKVLTKYVNV